LDGAGSFAGCTFDAESWGGGAAGAESQPHRTAPASAAATIPNPMLEMDLWAMGGSHYDAFSLKDSRAV